MFAYIALVVVVVNSFSFLELFQVKDHDALLNFLFMDLTQNPEVVMHSFNQQGLKYCTPLVLVFVPFIFKEIKPFFFFFLQGIMMMSTFIAHDSISLNAQ